ncbi:MAG TPA: hypothetical protein VJW76_17105 [Verrucomicrobiae bacterium]|nr:hypothetical protein [Verrucomicrobiae bacterium]
MGLFRTSRKADPISERARALSAEIAALEAQIRDLDTKAQQRQPRLRSTARPHGPGVAARVREPVFEEVDHHRVKSQSEPEVTPGHYNELGVRKFDLVGAWKRLQNHFHGPPANNPQLVNYLAAGSIQGLRPLRYEKRVARNRVIALTLILIAVGWGIVAVLSKH